MGSANTPPNRAGTVTQPVPVPLSPIPLLSLRCWRSFISIWHTAGTHMVSLKWNLQRAVKRLPGGQRCRSRPVGSRFRKNQSVRRRSENLLAAIGLGRTLRPVLLVEQATDHVIEALTGAFQAVKSRPVRLSDSDVLISVASHTLCYRVTILIVWAVAHLVNRVNHLQNCNIGCIGNFKAIVNVL